MARLSSLGICTYPFPGASLLSTTSYFRKAKMLQTDFLFWVPHSRAENDCSQEEGRNESS